LRSAFKFFLARQDVGMRDRAIVAMRLARAELEGQRRFWWRSWRDDVDPDTGCDTGRDEVFLLDGEEGEDDFRILGSIGGVGRSDAAMREAAAWLALDALVGERMAEERTAGC
jgi:hypothetical protein